MENDINVTKSFTPKFIVVVVGLLVVGGLANGYATYLAKKNFDEVTRLAEEAKTQQEELRQRRLDNSPDISNWQTYRNEKYGFEFKYPDGWSTTEGRGMDVYLRKTGSDNFPEISFAIIQSVSSLNLKNSKEESVNIDGKTATRISGESTKLADGSSWFITRIIINQNSRTYEIQADNFDEQLLIQILSTFKFIPSTGSSFKLLVPNGGETWRIGSSQMIRWDMGDFSKSSIILVSLVDGPTQGHLTLINPIPVNNQFSLKIPDSIIQGDVALQLQPGSYKLELELYDRVPCLGLCPLDAPSAKVLAQDQTDAVITILAPSQ